MGFSGIGIWEILLIIIVALIVLGPGRIPEIARSLGKAFRAIRKASSDLTTTVTRELEEVKKEPTPSPPEETKSIETPSDADNTGKKGQDDHPTKPERHQQSNE